MMDKTEDGKANLALEITKRCGPSQHTQGQRAELGGIMMEAILRLLDKLMGLSKPDIPEPPAMPPDLSPERQARLSDLYLELGSEMRALRATEASMAALFFTVVGLLFAGGISLLGSEKLSWSVKCWGIVGSSLFLLLFWFALHARILHDHVSYSHLMSRRSFLDAQWFWPDMPGRPPHLKGGHGGPGYRKTQALIALSALSVLTLLFAMLIAAYSAGAETKDSNGPTRDGAAPAGASASASAPARSASEAQPQPPVSAASRPSSAPGQPVRGS